MLGYYSCFVLLLVLGVKEDLITRLIQRYEEVGGGH